jgi:hypothetical protein
MTKSKKISSLACSSLIALLLCGSAQASMLTIKNDKNVPVEFSIAKDEANIAIVDKNGEAGVEINSVSIPAKQQIMVEVSRNAQNKDVYSLTGKGSAMSLSGTCKDLRIFKDYNIVFTDAATGTDCKATVKK